MTLRPLVAMLVCQLLSQGAASATPDDSLYAHPGRLVPTADGTRLNFYCLGSGSPTIVLDAGFEDWAPAWASVQPQLAAFTRTCSYDRAGAGFSAAGPMPRTSVRIADELHSALHNGGINGPYILVGHAFGGDNVRTFAERYMPEVAGLVLVEADPTDVEPKAMQADDHRGQPRFIAGLRECRDAVAAGRALPPLPGPPGRPASTCAQQFFRGLPEIAWSQALNAEVLRIAQTKVALYDAFISEMEKMPEDEAYLQQHHHFLGTRPIRVITTGNHGIGALDGQRRQSLDHLKYEYEVARAQARWLGMSSNAKQVFTRRSSEYVQFDEPAAVIDAIRDVYDQAKRE